MLPSKVNEKEGKAQFISDKEQLEVRLPIVREFWVNELILMLMLNIKLTMELEG